MVAKGSASATLDDVLRHVLLPRLAALRQLGLGDFGRDLVWDFTDAGDGLSGGDHGDYLGEGWWVGGCLLRV